MSSIAPSAALTVNLALVTTSKQELQEKKQNGIYYTPDRAAQILTRWAIRRPSDIVLEPSFGGCGFLVATRDRLLELGTSVPQNNLYGCDIDERAFEFLKNLLGRVPAGHFKQIDFLTISPTVFPKADAVIGNPPYVSLHNMQESQRTATRAIIAGEHDDMNGRASLWMYFVLHSLAFLKPGGRVAWILPGSFVYSDYSTKLRTKLEACFGRCLAIILEDRLFISEGTEESSVVLLCEGYQQGTDTKMRLTSAKGLSELEGAIERWSIGDVVGGEWIGRPQLALASSVARESYQKLLTKAAAHRLSEFANIKIGIVTGANRFFVLAAKQAESLGLPSESVTPILARFTQARGLQLCDADLQETQREGKRCLLVNTRHQEVLPTTVESYLATFPVEEKKKNNTFTRRTIWHQPDDGKHPDGFFSSMQTEGPVLVLNQTMATCTNTVYRVFFGTKVSDEKKRTIAVSLQSTFSQFSAEVEGRSYGHGALKIEPSEAKRIAILLPKGKALEDLDKAFAEIDVFLRVGNREGARNAADAFLLTQGLITKDQISAIQQGLQRLRQTRNGYRKETST